MIALLVLSVPAAAEETPPGRAPADTTPPPNAPVPPTPEPPPIPRPSLEPRTPQPLPPAPATFPSHLLDPLPVAGFSNGTFFLRDPKEWIVVMPKGRLQLDWFNFLNRGDAPAGVDPNAAKDPRPRDTFFVRRARVELQGTVMRHFDFQIAAEYASVPGAGSFGTVTDAFVIVDYLSFFKVQVGQFDAPFTLENRVTDKYIDFMERSAAVRAFGVPSNKELGGMILGWLPKDVAYYSLGVFNGDGQDFKNQDNNPAVIGRAFVAPLAWMAAARRNPWMRLFTLGGSMWWQRNNNIGGQAAANVTGAAQSDVTSMTTQGGVSFFNTNYANADATGTTVRSHLVPYGTTLKWAVEANIPIWRKLGLRFELVHQSIDLAQYNDSNPMNATLVRSSGLQGGNLDGLAYYIEAWGWILGDNSFLEAPGLETPPRITHTPVYNDPRWGLMVAAKYERVAFDVTGLPQTTTMSGAMGRDPAQGHYSLDVFELGVNAWATKHIRVTCNYVLNRMDGDSSQATKAYYHDRNEHELLLRVGLAL